MSKNSDFLKSLTSNPKPGIGPTKPASTPAPAKQYSDNAAYDDYDSPKPKLIRKGETQV